MNFTTDKNVLRTEMKNRRAVLSAVEVSQKSRAIFERLITCDAYINAKTILIYMASFNEPETRQIIASALAAGKRLAVPVSQQETHTLRLSYIERTDNMCLGAYGIAEPSTEHTAQPSDFDLIIIPGLAFGRNGSRLGFGAGYYDKLLCKVSAQLLALAYDFQVFDSLPSEPHDIPMDLILTESELIVCG